MVRSSSKEKDSQTTTASLEEEVSSWVSVPLAHSPPPPQPAAPSRPLQIALSFLNVCRNQCLSPEPEQFTFEPPPTPPPPTTEQLVSLVASAVLAALEERDAARSLPTPAVAAVPFTDIDTSARSQATVTNHPSTASAESSAEPSTSVPVLQAANIIFPASWVRCYMSHDTCSFGCKVCLMTQGS
eukprot:Protomagalhaensia_wolfi_Nauph_80__5988@NODE_80_length_3922_cov_281_132629_g61_i0_p4_GENE_NODE_80_length_3922_cov_281_132629_g61_i0NODE_80_length_3922_cov_281_132629_g61_i0_p4_ORF_typecomplete_len185_score19_01_NODE_80_length_3922_cov_281_132629_g61_i031585